MPRLDLSLKDAQSRHRVGIGITMFPEGCELARTNLFILSISRRLSGIRTLSTTSANFVKNLCAIWSAFWIVASSIGREFEKRLGIISK